MRETYQSTQVFAPYLCILKIKPNNFNVCSFFQTVQENIHRQKANKTEQLYLTKPTCLHPVLTFKCCKKPSPCWLIQSSTFPFSWNNHSKCGELNFRLGFLGFPPQINPQIFTVNYKYIQFFSHFLQDKKIKLLQIEELKLLIYPQET